MYGYRPNYLRRQARIKAERRLKLIRFAFIFFFLGAIFGWLITRFDIVMRSPILFTEPEMISPLPEESKNAPRGELIESVEAKEPEPTPTPVSNYVTGEASYYSIAGCLGCDPEAIMANGEKLDDTIRTLALTPEMVSRHKLLNDTVTVINLANGQKTRARVTDTGGFGKYGRVADLSLATKEAINCPSLCEVKIVLD